MPLRHLLLRRRQGRDSRVAVALLGVSLAWVARAMVALMMLRRSCQPLGATTRGPCVMSTERPSGGWVVVSMVLRQRLIASVHCSSSWMTFGRKWKRSLREQLLQRLMRRLLAQHMTRRWQLLQWRRPHRGEHPSPRPRHPLMATKLLSLRTILLKMPRLRFRLPRRAVEGMLLMVMLGMMMLRLRWRPGAHQVHPRRKLRPLHTML